MFVFNDGERVFAMCKCGWCAIIAFMRLNPETAYIKYYGNCGHPEPDFIFTTSEFKKLVKILSAAVDLIQHGAHAECEFGCIVDQDYREAISVCADSDGCIVLCKYKKKFKKFVKLHGGVDNFAPPFGGMRNNIPYEKCACDWSIVLDKEQAEKLVGELRDMVRMD